MRQRITNPKIAHIEEPILKGIAQKTYRYVHPDVATAFAIMAAGCAFASYISTKSNPAFFLLASVFVGVHYVMDGIDGKIAKLRGMDTPGTSNYRPYGWHIDKAADFISAMFFIAGFFWAVTGNMTFTGTLTGLFVIGYIQLMTYSSKSQKDLVMGGTESRLGLIALNVIAYVACTVF
ncbi:Uncharacterised protein [uncultured archaeon]|nr:Uncharacterised protein [uncultured archaeon]